MGGRPQIYEGTKQERKNAATRVWRAAHPEHKAQAKQEFKTWAQANPEKRAASKQAARLRRFGLTPETYDQKLATQGGGCAICGGPTNGAGRFHVDHDHQTSQVRGLLCSNCNLGLGHFQDDPSVLRRALAYLARYGKE